MFVVSQSATGQFVITHPPTNTVMVGDDLASTFEQMRAFAAGLDHAVVPVAGVPQSTVRPSARWGGLLAIALLPFVWLGALHVSLGRLVSELRAAPVDPDDGSELRARIERLEGAQGRPAVPPKKPRKSPKAEPPEPKPEPSAAPAPAKAPTPPPAAPEATDDDLD